MVNMFNGGGGAANFNTSGDRKIEVVRLIISLLGLLDIWNSEHIEGWSGLVTHEGGKHVNREGDITIDTRGTFAIV